MKPLSTLNTGAKGYITDLKDNDDYSNLFEIGCIPGEYFEIERNEPLAEGVFVKLKGESYFLPKKLADNVMTNVVNLYYGLN